MRVCRRQRERDRGRERTLGLETEVDTEGGVSVNGINPQIALGERHPQTKHARRDREKTDTPRKRDEQSRQEPPINAPKPPEGRAGLGISNKGQTTFGFGLPFLCLFRQRAVQGPERRKFHLQCTLHGLKRSFWSPESTPVLEGAAF